MAETVYILAYDDTETGDPYLVADFAIPIEDSLVTAIKVLSEHDNVLIVDYEAYQQRNHDYYTIAPYAIIITLGIYAKAEEYGKL